MNLANCFWRYSFISSFFTSSAKFSKIDGGNVILFQIKDFGINIKETTLAKLLAELLCE